jgi:hypothetical protein
MNIDDLDLNIEKKELNEELNEELDSVCSDDFLIDREPLNFIDVYFVYIDSNMAIEKIVCENEPVLKLENGKNGIHKDRILQFIQNKRFIDNKKYKLFHFFYYQVPLEQVQLQSFISNKLSEFPEFMKSPSYLTDLVIEDSMSIFHDLNSLFFFLKSCELRTLSKTSNKFNNQIPKRITKKVRFLDDKKEKQEKT